MPELPEVETVRGVLEPQLCGRRIISAAVLRLGVLARPEAEAFRRAVESERIKALGRRGKFLQIHLENGSTIIIHLRMTGRLLCLPEDYPPFAHTHIVLKLDNSWELRFIDTRRFGRFWLRQTGEKDDFSGIERLGPEPFDKDFSADYLREKLGERKITVKQALLDQSIVAGIGNIYADESLFASGIDPRKPAGDITKRGWLTLAREIPRILRLAIENNRVSAEEFREMRDGEYKHNDFYVYGRKGKECRVCGTAIESVRIAGRTSCFCPKCQR